ncbi:MAG: hypothetical protein JXJ17_04710 [Anaerolineae bacterium]|nr:hypothetical protein [Anaerolineae bacterium]
MANPEIFPAAASARRSISRTAYLLFGIGAGLMGCGATVFGMTTAANRSTTWSVALSGGIACAGVAGLIAGIVTLARLRQAIQVEVTPHRMVWREGKRTATLEYKDVIRVDFVKGQETRGEFTLEYPIVRFIESDGEMMEFDVTFEDRGMIHKSRFDARGITATVLRYLPPHVVITPTLDEFVQTGEVDLDLLANR